MNVSVRPLVEVLQEVPEVRKAQGLRHPLAAVLALACAAMLCGYRSYSAIAEWGRSYDPTLVGALGFTHDPTPCAATFCNVFRRLDCADLERRLGGWAEAVLQVMAASEGAGPEAVALDGKTLRGSRKQGAPAAHLLSAVSHRLGLTVGQMAVADKTNEIPMAPLLLAELVLRGRVFTMDALLTQRSIAETIVAGDGDYVMVVKGNQPQLEADLALFFGTPPALENRPGPRSRPGRPATDAWRSAG
jgi:hypothetical protein